MDLSKFDIAAIKRALDDHDPDREHFVVLADGSVWTFVFSEATDETREQYEAVQAGLGDTHVAVPSRSPQEAFEEIEDFVEEMKDEKLQAQLFTALEKKRAFRNFRETLLQHPEEHRRWRILRKAALQARLDGFLRSMGLEPASASAGQPA
jgi:23S rRNA maturation-related 3'-5' exoribonuclease YhaM